MPNTAVQDLPLRERKKALVRQAIIEHAKRLFEARGYDHVTVAEIADAANISVKTLFTYFRSKEDLLFQDSDLMDAILGALRNRPKETTPAQAIAAMLRQLAREKHDLALELSRYQQGYGSSDALKSRLLRLWAEYEECVAQELAKEAGLETPTLDIRYEAVLLVALVRAFTWPEMLLLTERASSSRTVTDWLKRTLKRIEGS